MNRLSPSATNTVEEHLLVCSPCINRVEDATEYVALFRAAASATNLAAELPY